MNEQNGAHQGRVYLTCGRQLPSSEGILLASPSKEIDQTQNVLGHLDSIRQAPPRHCAGLKRGTLRVRNTVLRNAAGDGTGHSGSVGATGLGMSRVS